MKGRRKIGMSAYWICIKYRILEELVVLKIDGNLGTEKVKFHW